MKKFAATAGKRAVILLPTLLLLAWLGSIFGCAGLERMVPVENRILFSERAAGDGVFSSGPLRVTFNYSLQDNTLNARGNVHFSGGYDSLNVYLLFIDASGNILQRSIVYYSGYRVGFWPGDNTFQTNLGVPANAVGFSFSYSSRPVTIRR